MKWYYIEITEACVLGGEYHRLCRQFQQAFIAAGAPVDMALFAETLLFNDTRKVYFSPGSVKYVEALIEENGGLPCATPDRSGLTLVFGVPDAAVRLLRAEDGPVEEKIRPLFPVEADELCADAVALAS